jgi:hypothetical protein
MQQVAFTDDPDELATLVDDRNSADALLHKGLGELPYRSRRLDGNYGRDHHIAGPS